MSDKPYYALIVPQSAAPSPPSRPVDPGYGHPDFEWSGNYPSTGPVPPGYVSGGPVPPGYVSGGPMRPGRPVDPWYGRPEYGGGYPSTGPVWPGGVDPGYGQGHPLPPHVWWGGRLPPHVGGGPMPGGPSVMPPIFIPGNELPDVPDSKDKSLMIVWVPGYGWQGIVIDSPKHEPPKDQPVPPTAEPKR